MMKLLLLLCVANVVGGEISFEQNEFNIVLNLKAGKVSFHLKAEKPFDPKYVLSVSIIPCLIFYEKHFLKGTSIL